jgi:hypothetical protein
MLTPEIPGLFTCKYIEFSANLEGGSKLNWTMWVSNRAIDGLFGITFGEEYLTADKFADEMSKKYLRSGLHVRLEDSSEEYIGPEKVVESSMVGEHFNPTTAEILVREAQVRAPQNFQVHPAPQAAKFAGGCRRN